LARSSALLTSCLLAANLAMVAWWTWLQVRHADELQTAAEHLRAGDADAAARALGAENADALPSVAAARRRMFLSEGIAFTAFVLLAGVTVLVTLRRQARLDADHDRFLAGATHELKTPLATIQLLLESLRGDRLPADKRDRYLQSGLVEAHRLEAGLTNLLTAAGLRGKVARRPLRSEGDLGADVQRAIASVQPRADAAGVRVLVESLPAMQLVRDPDAVQLVLHNLLDNAVKYTPRGGCVRVRLDADGTDAVLRVRDDGQGMDAEVLEHAFVPFWRGRHSETGGTGLGLFLVRALVQSHGGTVAAYSSGAGQGSELTVRLPRRGGAA
jgi:signal transduction histidine kinase